jgi:uncharacterized protein YkwD
MVESARQARRLFRMRGGASLVIGAAMMVVALCLASAVAVFAMRQDERAITSTPVLVDEAAPSEQIVEPSLAEPEMPKYERFDIPQSPRNTPEQSNLPPTLPPEPAPQEEVLSLVGEVPAANTTTLVRVKTCEGAIFALNAAEKKMLELHNQARAERGLGALCLSPTLTRLARARSEDMLGRDYFSHHTPEGATVMDQMKRLGYYGPNGYHLIGENIARGGDGTDTDTSQHLFKGFMHSPGHRENILREGFTEVGIGARSGTYRHYDDTSTVYAVVFRG